MYKYYANNAIIFHGQHNDSVWRLENVGLSSFHGSFYIKFVFLFDLILLFFFDNIFDSTL